MKYWYSLPSVKFGNVVFEICDLGALGEAMKLISVTNWGDILHVVINVFHIKFYDDRCNSVQTSIAAL